MILGAEDGNRTRDPVLRFWLRLYLNPDKIRISLSVVRARMEACHGLNSFKSLTVIRNSQKDYSLSGQFEQLPRTCSTTEPLRHILPSYFKLFSSIFVECIL